MRKTIGVFFGSRSPEHDVSIITAEFIIDGLCKLGEKVLPVYIGKNGEWHISAELGKLSAFTTAQSLDFEARGFDRYFLDLERSRGRLVFQKKGFNGKTVAIDLAFPATHGSYGEDGTLQGLFEMFNIPFVGCDTASSAIAMDKVFTKLMYQALGIPTTKFVSFTVSEWEKNREGIIEKASMLNAPLFVKPARLGSSIAITKVADATELETAIEVALHYDTKALVEEGVENLMDVTCALLGNDKPRASLLQESLFASDFFDYETKYLQDGGAQLGAAENNLRIPARLDEKTTLAIQTAAQTIYVALGCSGTARVDFLYNKKTEQWFANEINPLPGTLYHHLWDKSGVQFPRLLQELLALAKQKHTERTRVAYTFNSEILQQAGSLKLKTITPHTPAE